MSDKMRAMGIIGNDLNMVELPKPIPRHGEVLVTVIASVINPAEEKVMSVIGGPSSNKHLKKREVVKVKKKRHVGVQRPTERKPLKKPQVCHLIKRELCFSSASHLKILNCSSFLLAQKTAAWQKMHFSLRRFPCAACMSMTPSGIGPIFPSRNAPPARR